jgi:hypothetical protein
MQPPAAALLSRRVAENPVARPVGCLDAVIIADQFRFAVASPPLAMNALRAIGFSNAVARAAPDEKPRRMIGQFGEGFDFFRAHEKPRRTRQVFWPIQAFSGFKRGHAAHGAFRQRVLDRRQRAHATKSAQLYLGGAATAICAPANT